MQTKIVLIIPNAQKEHMKRILIIEDNPVIRENTAEILELADYKVYTAENGKHGIELAKSIIPDLIICDIMMTDLDGYGVLKILNKNKMTSGIPFIFLTAKSSKSDLRKGMNLGADDYITKPYEETDLLDAIETRIQRNSKIKELNNPKSSLQNDFLNPNSGNEAMSDLLLNRKEKVFVRKEQIYREEDYANYLYYVVSGKVKSIKTDSYGKNYVTAIHTQGDYFGYLTMLNNQEYHETAIAMEDTRIALIPKMDFISLVRSNNTMATKFIQLLSENVREKEERLLQLAYTPVRERVADALLKHKQKGNSFNFHPVISNISREDLAGIVGTTKESLIRMLSDLKREGIIHSEGSEITILDEVGLKRTATRP